MTEEKVKEYLGVFKPGGVSYETVLDYVKRSHTRDIARELCVAYYTINELKMKLGEQND